MAFMVPEEPAASSKYNPYVARDGHAHYWDEGMRCVVVVVVVECTRGPNRGGTLCQI